MACRVDWVIEVIVVSAEHKRDPLTKLTFFVDFWLRKPKPVVVVSKVSLETAAEMRP